ncbi:DUF932 domain-containing protein [bacterium]|nr:MAG: DUF932 domain-containing protein [bacterium]
MRLMEMSEAVQTLQEREKRFYDLELPVSEIRMNPDGTMRIGSFLPNARLQDQALTTLANRIGVQGGYLRRCRDDLIDLRAENVNRWLRKLPQDKNFFVRMDGCECRAILSTSYVPVSNLQILKKFQEYAPSKNGNTRVNLELDATAMACQIHWTDPNHTVELLTPGDVSHLGVHLGNSEVGFHSVEIAAFMFRLVCTNGMVVGVKTWSVRQTHLSCIEQLDETFEIALPSIIEKLPEMGSKFQLAMDITIEDPVEEIEQITNRNGLTVRQRKLVIETFNRTPDPTLFGVINSFTGAANREGVDWESRRILQRTGGAVLAGIDGK